MQKIYETFAFVPPVIHMFISSFILIIQFHHSFYEYFMNIFYECNNRSSTEPIWELFAVYVLIIIKYTKRNEFFKFFSRQSWAICTYLGNMYSEIFSIIEVSIILRFGVQQRARLSCGFIISKAWESNRMVNNIARGCLNYFKGFKIIIATSNPISADITICK